MNKIIRALKKRIMDNIFCMRVRIPAKRIVFMWLIVFFIMALLVAGVFFNLFFLQKWTALQPIIISVYALIMLVILIISLSTQYYEINKKDLTESKFGKKFTYFYSDVIYIDEAQSRKGKALTFVTNRGHVKYLTFDKDGKILDAFLSKCHNLISLEEVKRKFPGIKI